jgi:hypothetical protein
MAGAPNLRRSFGVAVAAALMVAGLACAAAQASEPIPADLGNASKFRLDLFAPTAPAFVVLGVSPRRAADPGAFREFGVDVANLSRGDNYKVGLALSTTPYWWGHSELTIASYRSQTTALERIAARTQLSLGLAFAYAKPKSYYNFGLGVQTQLLDRQDERFDAESYTCLGDAWDALRRPAAEAASKAVLDALMADETLSQEELNRIRDKELKKASASAAQFAEARKSCRDEASARALGKASLMVGAGVNSRTRNTSFDGFSYDGFAVWGTYRQPVVASGFVSVQMFTRLSWDESVGVIKAGTTSLVKGNTQLIGAGLALERKRWKSDVAVSYGRTDFTSPLWPDDDYYEVAWRGAVKVLDGIWLQASVARDFASRYDEDVTFGFNVHFNWDDLRRRI